MQTPRCIYYISPVTNPIIYSVRKREFRDGVKRTLKELVDCVPFYLHLVRTM